MPLQRAMVDFGSERSFAKATQALHEHYGIRVPETAEREITLKHAKTIEVESSVKTLPSQGASWVIAQTDGSFVPIVAFKPECDDKRKGRFKEYKEVRLCAARESGQSAWADGSFGNLAQAQASEGLGQS